VSNPFGKPGTKKEMAFQAINRHIKCWLYSWMRTLKSLKEYETSKRLPLVKWLKLAMVIQATTLYIAKNMINWLVQKTFSFIDRTVMYLRFYFRTYGEYSNSVAEVDVSAMKEGKLVMSSMHLSTSARSIVDKSDLQNSKKIHVASQAVMLTPLWSLVPTCY
jgi:hypothetical protein